MKGAFEDRQTPRLTTSIISMMTRNRENMDIDDASSAFVRGKGFAIPTSLSKLRGTAHGLIYLPLHVRAVPRTGRIVDIDNDWDRRTAYNDLLTDGLLEDILSLINRDLFIADWPHQWLPRSIALAWEQKFPELTGNISLEKG